MGTCPFFAILTKGVNFCDLLLAFLNDESSPLHVLGPKGENFLVFMRGRRKRTVKLLPLKVYLLTYNYSNVNMGVGRGGGAASRV